MPKTVGTISKTNESNSYIWQIVTGKVRDRLTTVLSEVVCTTNVDVPVNSEALGTGTDRIRNSRSSIFFSFF
ncbi:MAG: hypothetical protein IH594_01130 [Bacteroidales bacterium]|nr:hypothetical protein [Bacteroidales bacterium]